MTRLKNEIAVVFGGTGFIGRQVVRELARLGYRVKVATHIPEKAYFLRTCGVVGQIVPVACRSSDPVSVGTALRGASLAVNCIGILYERSKQSFHNAHVDIPGTIAAACADEGVERFVHISALGVESSGSEYARTKFQGEQMVRQSFPPATILRPSVVFGEDDTFFNMFARLAQILPFLPLIGGGKTKFQPVYVGDIADAVMAALTRPALGPGNPQGKVYELGGPEVLSFKDIMLRLFTHTGVKRPLVSIPFGLAKIQAAVMSLMPSPLLTPDQVESLKTDTIVSHGALGLHDLGIQPTMLDIILPTYLSSYRPGGRFAASEVA